MYYNCQMMFVFLLFLLSLLFLTIILFSFKRFSPVPYFPSNKKDMSLIIDMLDLKNNQTVIDLGAGDGIVIFEAAESALKKELDTQFVAVDINPILIFILHLRRLFHPNKKNIKILHGDFFSLNFHSLAINYSPSTSLRTSLRTTIYLYISPWFLDRVTKRVLQQIPMAKFVSYMYPIKFLKKRERITKGKNKIFTY